MNRQKLQVNIPRITERNYKDLFIQSPVPIAIYTGSSLVYTFVNEAYSKIFNNRNIVGKTLREAFPELEGQPFFKIIEGVYETGVPYTGTELPAVIDVKNNGVFTTRYYNLVYTPFLNAEGEIDGVMATGLDVTEQVVARQKIAESEERLRIAIYSAQMGTWDYNPVTKAIYCSDRTKELFGFKPEDNVDLAMALEVIVEADRERVLIAIQNALNAESGGNYEIEYSIIDLYTKKERTIKAQGKAFFHNGVPSRMVGTAMDITREVQLKKDQQKLLCLIENSADFMALADIDGNLLYLNKEGQRLVGLNFEQDYNPGLHVKDFYTKEHFEKIRTTVISTVLKKGSWSGTIYLRHFVTHEIIPCNANYIAIKDPGTGEVIGRGVTIRDLRAEIAAQKALAESEKNLRTLIMQAPVGIGILRGPNMAVELANDAYDEISKSNTHLSTEDLEHGNLPASDSLPVVLKEVMRTGVSYYRSECEIRLIRHNTQQTHYIDCVYHPLKDIDGTVNGILNIIIDVTDKVLARKKVEESEKELHRRVQDRTNELEKKNIELEQFTYAASHDMQEPLRKVQIFSNFLLQNNLDQLDEKGKVYLQKMESSVTRMKTLIDDLLQYSHQNKGSVEFLPIDLNQIVDNVAADLELLIQQKNATISKEFLPEIIAIPSQINQLFYNLISNALKFSFAEKPVEINISVRELSADEVGEKRFNKSSAYREFSFSDNGIGFEQEYAEQIFSLFKRLHGRSEYAGTGIGLALCKKIVGNHGGIIYAKSALGQGATFNVILPY